MIAGLQHLMYEGMDYKPFPSSVWLEPGKPVLINLVKAKGKGFKQTMRQTMIYSKLSNSDLVNKIN